MVYLPFKDLDQVGMTTRPTIEYTLAKMFSEWPGFLNPFRTAVPFGDKTT